MDDDREHRIRNRAYELWESEGRPEGEHDRHWKMALAELGLLDPTTLPVTSGGSDNAEDDALRHPLPPSPD